MKSDDSNGNDPNNLKPKNMKPNLVSESYYKDPHTGKVSLIVGGGISKDRKLDGIDFNESKDHIEINEWIEEAERKLLKAKEDEERKLLKAKEDEALRRSMNHEKWFHQGKKQPYGITTVEKHAKKYKKPEVARCYRAVDTRFKTNPELLKEYLDERIRRTRSGEM